MRMDIYVFSSMFTAWNLHHFLRLLPAPVCSPFWKSFHHSEISNILRVLTTQVSASLSQLYRMFSQGLFPSQRSQGLRTPLPHGAWPQHLSENMKKESMIPFLVYFMTLRPASDKRQNKIEYELGMVPRALETWLKWILTLCAF